VVRSSFRAIPDMICWRSSHDFQPQFPAILGEGVVVPTHGRRAALGRLFVAVALLALVLSALILGGLGRTALRQPFATSSPSATSGQADRFVSELTPAGVLKSSDSPEAMRLAAAKATGLFADTHWEDFVVWTRRLAGSDARRTWIVHIEPKSGGPDSTIWVKIVDGDVREYGIRWGEQLKGYRGKLAPSAARGGVM
jgi:hypothetical protein